MSEHPSLQIGVAEQDARLVLHCAPEDAAKFMPLLLGKTMLRAEPSGSWHALHLAPDEWLLAGPPHAKDALVEQIGLVTACHSLVDVSDRTKSLELTGASAPIAINGGCPLDLGDKAFPVTACTRTLLGKASVLLWRTGKTAWRVEYGRSFDDYITNLLEYFARTMPDPRS